MRVVVFLSCSCFLFYDLLVFEMMQTNLNLVRLILSVSASVERKGAEKRAKRDAIITAGLNTGLENICEF